jgi:hypothetical protein
VDDFLETSPVFNPVHSTRVMVGEDRDNTAPNNDQPAIDHCIPTRFPLGMV